MRIAVTVLLFMIVALVRAADSRSAALADNRTHSAEWTAVVPPSVAGSKNYALTSVIMTGEGTAWTVGDVILRYEGGEWSDSSIPGQLGDLPILYAIDMVSDTDGWAVGDEGLIVRYADSEWSIQESPTSNALTGIDMLSTSEGWAVGGSGTILYYDGVAWSEYTSPTSAHLTAVSMASSSDGWSVGDALLHYSYGDWTVETSPSEARLTALDMVSESYGWAGGFYGTLMRYASGWSNTEPQTELAIAGIDMLSDSDGWAVGAGDAVTLLKHYDGNSWSAASVPGPQNPCEEVMPADVSMVSATEGVAVGLCGTILEYGDVSINHGAARTLFLPYGRTPR